MMVQRIRSKQARQIADSNRKAWKEFMCGVGAIGGGLVGVYACMWLACAMDAFTN